MTGSNPRGRPRQAGRITGDSTTRAASAPGAADRASSLRAVPAAFYGRTARATGTGDSQADRYRQLALRGTVVAACGAPMTAGFFDESHQADDLWQDRPRGRSLLAALPGAGSAAAEYALLGRLLLGPAAAPGGTAPWQSFRDRRARRSQLGQPAAGLCRRLSESR
jgi:hypothetical protein